MPVCVCVGGGGYQGKYLKASWTISRVQENVQKFNRNMNANKIGPLSRFGSAFGLRLQPTLRHLGDRSERLINVRELVQLSVDVKEKIET